MGKRNSYNNKLMAIVAPVLLISSFLYFHFIVPYHLCFKEQIQLFIYDSTYILSYFSKPGGLACLTGDFLTQFFYFKEGGAIIISLLLFLEWLLTVKILNSFGVKQMASLWALLPVIAECIVIWDIYFSIAMSVSFLLLLFVFFIYTRFKNNTVSCILGIILIPALYFLLGSSMFLFPVAILLYEISTGKKRFFYWLILIALSVITPYFLRPHFLITMHQTYFYPYIGIKQQGSLIMMVLILLFSSFKIIRNKDITVLLFSLTIFFILVFGIAGLKLTTNLEREKILEIATEAYYENWDNVLKIAEKSNYDEAIISYYTNIALSKKTLLGERMMEFYQPFVSGLFLPVDQESNWFVSFFSNDVFYHIGDMNLAQYSAMLSMTFSPYQRSSRLIKRLIEINLVADDIPAAMKYIGILESSLFHKKTASQLKEMALTTQPDDYPELQKKRSQIHTINFLRSSQNQQTSLELLLKSNPANQAALDYLLSYHLMNKSIQGFFNVYSSYCKGKTNHVPKMYAEALLIYFAASKMKPEKIKEYNINTELNNDFKEYTKLYESLNGDLKLLQEKFSDSYWLFYNNN